MRRRAANADLEKVVLTENLKDVDQMAKRLQIDKETVIEVSGYRRVSTPPPPCEWIQVKSIILLDQL